MKNKKDKFRKIWNFIRTNTDVDKVFKKDVGMGISLEINYNVNRSGTDLDLDWDTINVILPPQLSTIFDSLGVSTSGMEDEVDIYDWIKIGEIRTEFDTLTGEIETDEEWEVFDEIDTSDTFENWWKNVKVLLEGDKEPTKSENVRVSSDYTATIYSGRDGLNDIMCTNSIQRVMIQFLEMVITSL